MIQLNKKKGEAINKKGWFNGLKKRDKQERKKEKRKKEKKRDKRVKQRDNDSIRKIRVKQ